MSSVTEDQPVLDGIRALMKKRKITLRELASRVGIPYRTLQNYLNGNSRFPAYVFLNICETLGLGRHYVLSGSADVSYQELVDSIIQVFGDELLKINVDPQLGKVTVSDIPSRERSHKAIVGHLLANELSKAYVRYFEDTLAQSTFPRRPNKD